MMITSFESLYGWKSFSSTRFGTFQLRNNCAGTYLTTVRYSRQSHFITHVTNVPHSADHSTINDMIQQRCSNFVILAFFYIPEKILVFPILIWILSLTLSPGITFIFFCHYNESIRITGDYWHYGSSLWNFPEMTYCNSFV